MKRYLLILALVTAGCAAQAEPQTVPPTTYCTPWVDVIDSTCVTIEAVPAGSFGDQPRTACRTTDGTVWSTYSFGGTSGTIRYVPVGDAGTPGAWALDKAVCQ